MRSRSPINFGSSIRKCDHPYYEWGEDAPDDWSDSEVRNERAQPHPTMAYFGPALAPALRMACPPYHAGESGYVYHLLDRWGRVLYIGKSKNPSQRVFQHVRRLWWQQLATVRVFASTEYHELEIEDINSLSPAFNVAGVSNG